MARVDLNADVGESFGVYSVGADQDLLNSVTSASIAAGFHAGDPSVLRATIRLARSKGVAVGAHPGFPDLAGFGRRELRVTPGEAEDFVLYQIAAVRGVAAAEGVRLNHVKPHGALYNMAARDSDLAGAIARAVASVDPELIVFAPPGSALERAGRSLGLAIAVEGFPDRAYAPDGALAARSEPGAVIHDPETVVERAIRMVTRGSVCTIDGSEISFAVDTICLHGDTAGAATLAAAVRRGLESAGVTVRAVGLD